MIGLELKLDDGKAVLIALKVNPIRILNGLHLMSKESSIFLLIANLELIFRDFLFLLGSRSFGQVFSVLHFGNLLLFLNFSDV